jgi:hypothetical protein
MQPPASRGIRIQNHHRPLNVYMRALLDAGLTLAYFIHGTTKRQVTAMFASWLIAGVEGG